MSRFSWLLTERANFHQVDGNEVCVREEAFLEIDGVKRYDFRRERWNLFFRGRHLHRWRFAGVFFSINRQACLSPV